MKRYSAILLLAILATGCTLGTSTERMNYPDRWPPLVSIPACASLPGHYRPMAENAQPSSNSVNSPTLFGLFRSPVAKSATHVQLELNQEQSILVLRAYEGEAMRQEISVPVTCVNGSLIHLDQASGSGDGTSSEWQGKVTLTKATDGSLIAHTYGRVQSSDLLFGWGHSYDTLYRFVAQDSQ